MDCVTSCILIRAKKRKVEIFMSKPEKKSKKRKAEIITRISEISTRKVEILISLFRVNISFFFV